ncbi:30S ribosomal protein S4e [Candidatus Woesearchaeota archaeon]|nr:30S ribosomal protein S4e [Candidatus Woesearchaeota archaeon]
MKNHLKRLSSPKTWMINRKKSKYVIRPKAGAHALSEGIALGLIIRDELKLASTLAETRKVLNNNEILVDGKRRKEYRFIVGLFDVITIPHLYQLYRVMFDQKGRIIVVTISPEESKIKVCKIVGKTVLANNKVQFNLHDGKNIIADIKAKVGDSIVVSLPSLEIIEVLPLAPKAVVFLTKGKHKGGIGIFKEIKGDEGVYLKEGEEIKTAKEYLFVIGKDKPVMEIKSRAS